jgi:ABC-type transport system substrate-binding protein
MTAEALFKSGGGEVIKAYDAMMAKNLQAAGFKVVTMPGTGSQLWPDSANADSPWANVKVRMAAEYALDKEGMARTFGYGASEASYQSNPPTSMAYDASLTPRKYDVAKAKALLSEAGYPEGFKTNIYVGPFGGDKNIATAIQAYWNAVGIKADLQYPQAGAWSGMLTGKWKGGVLYGAGPLAANPNSGWALTYTEGSAWFGSLKRPDGFYDLYKASVTAANLDPVLLKKCEAALYNDCNTIPLSISLMQWVVRDEVVDHGLGSRGMFAWWEHQDAWLNK